MQHKEHATPRHTETSPDIHEGSQELTKHPSSNDQRFNAKEAHKAPENARHEAIQKALLNKEQGKEKRTHQAQRHNASHALTQDDREASFGQTMNDVRKDLPRSVRPFSKFIHGPTIERASELLSKTIFRPNAILAGGITAFIAVLGIYFYAKYAGFSLQGSETIIAFCIGWVLGILFDFFKAILPGKR